MRRILPAVLVTVLGAATMSVGCSDATNLGPLAQLDEVKRLRAAGEHAEGGAAPAAVASSGTGWGTLQGNFVFLKGIRRQQKCAHWRQGRPTLQSGWHSR